MTAYWPEILISTSFYIMRTNLAMPWWPCPIVLRMDYCSEISQPLHLL